jgi:RNA polymerase sigma factor (sigma-70 family)
MKAYPWAHTATREDALQDTFVRFIEAIRGGKLKDAPTDVLGYIRRLARYKLFDRIKTRPVGLRPSDEARITDIQEDVRSRGILGPVTEIRSRENEASLKAALNKLTPHEKGILELRFKGLSYPEIAAEVGKDAATVRKVFDNGHRKFMRHLAVESPTLAGNLQDKSRGAEGIRPEPTRENIRSAVEVLPPEVREVIALLHLEGKPMDEVIGKVGYEKMVARRDRGYQLLRAKFGVPFPEAFGEKGA